MTTPHRISALAFALSIGSALLLAGCGAAEPSSPGLASATASGDTSPVAVASPTTDPAATTDPGATLPAESPMPASEEPAVVDPDAEGAPGSVGPVAADQCAGSPENRSFFGVAAASLSWQVYCASLPEGWLVQSGSYRLGNGGSLKVAYAGPDGARFELREGAICAEDSSCVPSGDDLGIVQFGDREARLLAWDGGGYAAMVDGGAPLSWVAYGVGLDEATFRSVVAGLLPVAATQ